MKLFANIYLLESIVLTDFLKIQLLKQYLAPQRKGAETLSSFRILLSILLISSILSICYKLYRDLYFYKIIC